MRIMTFPWVRLNTSMPMFDPHLQACKYLAVPMISEFVQGIGNTEE
jgi:hypothetical protein